MKKVVLFLGIATAVAFASCGNRNVEAPAVNQEPIEAPAEEPADSTVVVEVVEVIEVAE